MAHCDVLVVDDDPGVRTTVAEILESEGYTVATAENGLEALRALETVSPELVLLDMQMPVLDGWEFARKLRERGLRLTILVVSAAQEARRWAREIGACGALRKPFELFDLLEAVSQQCHVPGSRSS